MEIILSKLLDASTNLILIYASNYFINSKPIDAYIDAYVPLVWNYETSYIIFICHLYFKKKIKNTKIHVIFQQKYQTKKQQELCKTNLLFYLVMEEYK